MPPRPESGQEGDNIGLDELDILVSAMIEVHPRVVDGKRLEKVREGQDEHRVRVICEKHLIGSEGQIGGTTNAA